MQKVGYLKEGHAESGENYRGQISTLDFTAAVSLIKNTQKNSDKSPDFEIFAEGKQGNQVKVGAAWKKQSPKCQFLNLKIDDPSLSDVLYFKAFKEDDDSWKIVWQR